MKICLLLALLAGHVALAQVKLSNPALRARPDLLRVSRADAHHLDPPLTQMVIAGQVQRVDSLRIGALAGALVSVPLPTGSLSTHTDANGKFSLTLSPANLAALPDSVPVIATAMGWMSQTIKRKKAAQATIIFQLRLARYHVESGHITLPTAKHKSKKTLPTGGAASEQAFWPPPQCSTLERLNSRYFAQARTLADVDDILYNALNAATYDDLRYYYAPNGFVLITRIEQTNADGVALPGKERWSVDVPEAGAGSSFANYLRALFIPASGHFRVIAFAVTDQPIAHYRPAPQEGEAREWLQQGADELDPKVGALPYGPGYHCTALIYEFEKSADRDGPLVVPGHFTAAEHLAKSRITTALPKLTP